MQIRFNKVWGIVIVSLAALNIVLALLARYHMGLATGALILIGGILFLFNAPIEVDDNEIRVKNLFGMTLRTYELRSLADVVFEGGKVMVPAAGGGLRKARGVSRLMSDPGDWAKFEALVQETKARS